MVGAERVRYDADKWPSSFYVDGKKIISVNWSFRLIRVRCQEDYETGYRLAEAFESSTGKNVELYTDYDQP